MGFERGGVEFVGFIGDVGCLDGWDGEFFVFGDGLKISLIVKVYC